MLSGLETSAPASMLRCTQFGPFFSSHRMRCALGGAGLTGRTRMMARCSIWICATTIGAVLPAAAATRGKKNRLTANLPLCLPA